MKKIKVVFYYSPTQQEEIEKKARKKDKGKQESFFRGKQYTEIKKKPPYEPTYPDSEIIYETYLPECDVFPGQADIDILKGWKWKGFFNM